MATSRRHGHGASSLSSANERGRLPGHLETDGGATGRQLRARGGLRAQDPESGCEARPWWSPSATAAQRLLERHRAAVARPPGGDLGPGNRDGRGRPLQRTSRRSRSDGAGNLYSRGGPNQTIPEGGHRWGVVTTFAGAPGQYGAAGPERRRRLFHDSLWNRQRWGRATYVADAGNNAIVMTTGVSPSTFAGGGQADDAQWRSGPRKGLFRPGGIASDGAGNLCDVADTDNSTIRKIRHRHQSRHDGGGLGPETGALGTGPAPPPCLITRPASPAMGEAISTLPTSTAPHPEYLSIATPGSS